MHCPEIENVVVWPATLAETDTLSRPTLLPVIASSAYSPYWNPLQFAVRHSPTSGTT